MTVKEQLHEAIDALPDDCTYDQMEYHLYELIKIRRGFAAADRGETISQEDLEQIVNEWDFESDGQPKR